LASGSDEAAGYSAYAKAVCRSDLTVGSLSDAGSVKIVPAVCRIRSESFVVQVRGRPTGLPGKGGDVPEYLIAFNGQWVPEPTVEEVREKSKAVRALRAEMKAAGVFVFLGGLDESAPVFSVDASSGTPVFTDGPYVESKEYLGGFTVVDVADEQAARLWAGKIAVACGWPQEVRRFQVPVNLQETS
jgi:hypothetical protein